MSDSIERSEHEPTVAELLGRAKQAIESGDAFYRAAGEAIAAAQLQGATQREIADAVGKSAAWVNALLKWYSRGNWDETPFGPQSQAGRRRRAEPVQEPEQENQQPTCPDEQQQAPDNTTTVEAPEQERPNPATTREQAQAPDDTTTVEAPTVTVRSPSLVVPPLSDAVWSLGFQLAKPGVTFLVGGMKAAVLEVAVKIGATVSAGGEWPDYRRAERGSVVWLSSLSTARTFLRPQFEAAEAYLQGVHFLEAALDHFRLPIRNLADDMRRLDRYIAQEGPVKCVVIDHFSEYLRFGDTKRSILSFQKAAEALQEIAVKHDVAIVLPCQLSTRDDDAVAEAVSVVGSLQGINAVFLIKRADKKNCGTLLPSIEMANLGSNGFPFQLRNRNCVPAVAWDNLPIDVFPNIAIAPAAPQHEGGTEPVDSVEQPSDADGADGDHGDDHAAHNVDDAGTPRSDKRFELVSHVVVGDRSIPVVQVCRPGKAKPAASTIDDMRTEG